MDKAGTVIEKGWIEIKDGIIEKLERAFPRK